MFHQLCLNIPNNFMIFQHKKQKINKYVKLKLDKSLKPKCLGVIIDEKQTETSTEFILVTILFIQFHPFIF